MTRRWLAFGFVLAFAVFEMTGCGSSLTSSSSSSSTLTSTTQGTLQVVVTDVPLCNVMAFRTLVTALAVTPKGTTGSNSILSSSADIGVDWAALQDTSSILAMTAQLPPATYTSGTLTVAAPSMSLFDPTQSPPIESITPTFSTESLNFTINPALVVTVGKVSVLQLEFNLPQSIQLNSQGQVSTTGSPGSLTVNVTPVVNAKALSASSSQGFGEMDDVNGYVLSITNSAFSSGSSQFAGSFVLQLLSGLTTISPGGGPSVTVAVPSNCTFTGSPVNTVPTGTSGCQVYGTPALNQLTTGNFAEVNGYLDTNGDFVANTVVVEDRSDLTSDFTTFLGDILSVTRGANGNVTQFTMTVSDEEPSTGSATSGNPVLLDSPPLIVSVPSSVGFHFSSAATNFAGVTPDATSLAVGQRVAVSATYVPPPSTSSGGVSTISTTATAQSVYIPLQTVSGNFAELLSAGSDNVTGTFRLTPCSTVFQGQPVYVFTSAQTQFQNVNGLAGLTAPPELQVRGLLYFDQAGGTLQGVDVPPGSYVMLASAVHQL